MASARRLARRSPSITDVIPKTLGASDWSADVLAPEQLEYAALDAVLCRLLWLTQQNELFDDIDKQCQELADTTVPAVARMDLQACQSTSTPTASRLRNGSRISPQPRPRCAPPRHCETYSDRLSCRSTYEKC